MSDEPEPTPPDRARAHARTEARQALFLEAFARTGNVSQAAEESGTHRSVHYDWLQDPIYQERFKSAEKAYCDALTAEAVRRAIVGVERPIFQGGREVGRVREFSDALLMFLMKGAMPGLYRENVKAPDPDAPPLDLGFSARQRQLLMDELDALEAERDAATPGEPDT